MEEDKWSEEWKSYDEEESAYKILTLLWFFVLLITMKMQNFKKNSQMLFKVVFRFNITVWKLKNFLSLSFLREKEYMLNVGKT